jgi:hypothetical protein
MATDNFTTEDWKMIFHAVRYYQMHKVTLNSKSYHDCDRILNEIFPVMPLPEPSTPVPHGT